MSPAPPPGSPPPHEGTSAELLARVPKLLDAMRSVGSGLGLHATLNRICETAADLAHARYAAIGVVDQDGEGLADFVHHGVDEATARCVGHLPDGRKGLLGALIRDPEPVRLTDLTEDPRSCGFPDHHPPMRSFLGVPIRVQGEIFGNLYLTGQDFAVPVGTPVRSVGTGRVLKVSCGGAFGIQVVIEHPGGYYTQYAHLAAAAVDQGDRIRAGQWIGQSGSTGNSTGPHLHFEVRVTPEMGSALDPVPWLSQHGVPL
ncbi:GAF domain-containing protein OS=Streptomyces tendae OX=1932 GN=GUR47_21305 PE=4 SV=1 [Streptomyces tendae]